MDDDEISLDEQLESPKDAYAAVANRLDAARIEIKQLKLRLQNEGICPHHDVYEFGCEPCADIIEKLERGTT